MGGSRGYETKDMGSEDQGQGYPGRPKGAASLLRSSRSTAPQLPVLRMAGQVPEQHGEGIRERPGYTKRAEAQG